MRILSPRRAARAGAARKRMCTALLLYRVEPGWGRTARRCMKGAAGRLKRARAGGGAGGTWVHAERGQGAETPGGGAWNAGAGTPGHGGVRNAGAGRTRAQTGPGCERSAEARPRSGDLACSAAARDTMAPCMSNDPPDPPKEGCAPHETHASHPAQRSRLHGARRRARGLAPYGGSPTGSSQTPPASSTDGIIVLLDQDTSRSLAPAASDDEGGR